jgi:hypothetical protein
VDGLSRHSFGKRELCLVQSARGQAALAGRFSLRMRYFSLMLYASAENRDWGVGCIESRSYHILNALCIFMEFTTQGGPFQVHLIRALLHTSPKRIKAYH